MNKILLPIALTAIVAALVLAMASAGNRMASVVQEPAVIAVEHGTPLKLTLTVGEGKMPGMLDASHDGTGPVKLSVPSGWTLREVRNAALKDVPADPPSLGFTRWVLPPRAVLSFSLPAPPTGLTVMNPSGIPLHVTLTRVDLAKDTAEEETFLLTEESLRLY